MRVVFWGTPQFADTVLRALIEAGHDVVGVVTQPDRPAGRGRKMQPPPVKLTADGAGIPVLQPEKPWGDEFMAAFRRTGVAGQKSRSEGRIRVTEPDAVTDNEKGPPRMGRPPFSVSWPVLPAPSDEPVDHESHGHEQAEGSMERDGGGSRVREQTRVLPCQAGGDGRPESRRGAKGERGRRE